MDGELVKKEDTEPPSLTETFDKALPWYISIGMSPHEFWDEDPCLAVAYREAWEQKEAIKSRDLWLQGMYFYEALCSALSAMFSKRGNKKLEYRSEPVPLTTKAKEALEERKERERAEETIQRMKQLMESINRKQEARRNGNGNDN